MWWSRVTVTRGSAVYRQEVTINYNCKIKSQRPLTSLHFLHKAAHSPTAVIFHTTVFSSLLKSSMTSEIGLEHTSVISSWRILGTHVSLVHYHLCLWRMLPPMVGFLFRHLAPQGRKSPLEGNFWSQHWTRMKVLKASLCILIQLLAQFHGQLVSVLYTNETPLFRVSWLPETVHIMAYM